MSLPYPSIRAASGYAAVARRRLQVLCEALRRAPGTVGSKSEFFDGFLLRASKVAGRVTGTLVDVPHRIGWSGGVTADAYGATPAGLTVYPYLAVPMRDVLLNAQLVGAFDSAPNLPPTLVNPPLAYFTGTIGGFNTASVHGNTARTGRNFLTHNWLSIFYQASNRIGVAAWDHLRGGDTLGVFCVADNLPAANGRIEDGVVTNPSRTDIDAQVSLLVTEAFVTAQTGARMCCRYYLPTNPPTPPTGPAEAFRNAQSPWCAAIATHLAPGVMRWVVAVHVTRQDNEEADFLGERGVYIANLLVINDPDVATPGAYLVGGYYRRNYLDGSTDRQPQFVEADPGPGPGAWAPNTHIPYDLTFADADTTLVYGSFSVYRDDGGTLYTAEIHRMSALTGALLATTRLADGVDTDSADVVFANTLGVDSPGDGTAVAIGCHPTAQAPFGVAVIDGASVAKEYYSPGFYHYGGGVGQTIGCVEYIGNGKYAFPVSSAMPEAPSYSADWCVAVYDVAAKTLLLAGTIEPTRPLMNTAGGTWIQANIYTGRMCCVQAELADDDGEITRHATVLATIGPYGLTVGSLDGRAGRTYISYDSCATWHKVVDYGSPRGVVYGGNPAFRPAPRQIIRG